MAQMGSTALTPIFNGGEGAMGYNFFSWHLHFSKMKTLNTCVVEVVLKVKGYFPITWEYMYTKVMGTKYLGTKLLIHFYLRCTGGTLSPDVCIKLLFGHVVLFQKHVVVTRKTWTKSNNTKQ